MFGTPRMTPVFSRLGSIFLALTLLASGMENAVAQAFERDSLVIETAGGEQHKFQVELAITPSQHAQGLMYRQSLAEDAGMLFVDRYERKWNMWMANTYIPLDMLFLDQDGIVVGIAERTVPLSRDHIPSGAKAKAVLELNAGTVDRLDIAIGDRVLHSSFNNE